MARKRTTERWWVGTSLVLALLAFSASGAQASGAPFSDVSVGGLMLAFGGVTLGGMFAVVDAVYGVQGELLPKGWAIAQLAVPAPLLLGAAISDGHNADAEFRVWCAAFSAWFFGHGIWSLAAEKDDLPPPGRASPHAHWFSLAPVRGGAAFAVTGVL